MSLQVEKMEKNMAKLTVEVEAERLEKALDTAYNSSSKMLSNKWQRHKMMQWLLFTKN